MKVSGYRHIGLALAAAFLFGVSTPLGKVLLSRWSPQQLAGLLYLGAALGVSIPILVSRSGWLVKLGGKNAWRLGGAILFGGILGPVFLLAGLKIASSSAVSLWLNLEMVATSLLGAFVFRDHLGKLGWVGATCVLAAGFLLSLGEGPAGLRAGLLLGLACLCWGIDNNLTSLIDGLTPMQSTFWKGLASGTVNCALAFGFGQAVQAGPRDFAAALAIGVVSYGASIMLYITAAQQLGATRSQMVFASAPLFGVAVSATWLHEPITLFHGLALAMQIAGTWLLFRDRHEHTHPHELMEHIHSHSHDDGHHVHAHQGQPTSLKHTHSHRHEAMAHSHPHWPDLHHRHGH